MVIIDTDTMTHCHEQYADALCSVTLSVWCVTGYGTDNATAIDIDTDINTDTADTDTEAACKLYFVNRDHMSHISI